MAKHFPHAHKTRLAILLSSLLHEPFSSLYPLLPFVLLKSLGATAFQIVLLTMLKPVSSIFSLYWSERVSQNRHTLKMSLLGSGLLARLPFLFVLFFDNVWLFIAASTCYMLFSRAGIPAWIEMLKVNLPDKIRQRAFSFGSALGYAEGVLIAIGIGSLMDQSMMSWKICFGGATIIGLVGLFVQMRVPVGETKQEEPVDLSVKEVFLRPWRDCLELMKTRPDFRLFQWSFMVGGLGLMIIQPVIPIFFTETLQISYRDLMIAFSICKGMGFVLTASLWSRAMDAIPVGWFTSLVLVGFAAFPCLIICKWIYAAYFVYGVAQAGSHLIWHLSGPLFAGGEKSSRYSGVNIVMVGMRGILGPPLGGLLLLCVAPVSIFVVSASLCLSGIAFQLRRKPSLAYTSSHDSDGKTH